jgi:hypothetical protein
MHKLKCLTISILLVLSFSLAGQSFIVSARPLAVVKVLGLGYAASFAVLGGTIVNNTGATVVNGNLGVSPGRAATVFPPGIVIGIMHLSGAVAVQAQIDVVTAFNSLAGMTLCAALSSPITTT